MASTSTTSSLEQAIDLCLQSDSEGNSDIDSETQGLSTDEEQELDEQLTKESESDGEIR